MKRRIKTGLWAIALAAPTIVHGSMCKGQEASCKAGNSYTDTTPASGGNPGVFGGVATLTAASSAFAISEGGFTGLAGSGPFSCPGKADWSPSERICGSGTDAQANRSNPIDLPAGTSPDVHPLGPDLVPVTGDISGPDEPEVEEPGETCGQD